MTETWKPVPGYGGHYEASDMGRVRAKARVVEKLHGSGAVMRQSYQGRVLTPAKGPHGHLRVHIGFDRKRLSVFVHTFVLLAFVGARPDGMEACHGNGDAGDNRPSNLRWDTHYENNRDRHRHGRYATGEAHPMAKLKDEDVRTIRGLMADGFSRKELMRRFSISATTYHAIKRGERRA